MKPIAFSAPSMTAAEVEAVSEVILSGWLVGGPKLAQFERAFADACGVRHAVGVTSWTTGAALVLYAWGIGSGDEVIVPSYSFIATASVIVNCGAIPVFADIDPATWNIDPIDVERKVSDRTKAIMPVDQLGLPCDIEAINATARRYGLKVLDDAACALGSSSNGQPVGSLAEVTVFSLHARKLVTTGEGGMILTDDDALAERLRRLRHHGATISDLARSQASPLAVETYPEVGFNLRMTDIQAALGLVQLDRLPRLLRTRREQVERYQAFFREHPYFQAPIEPPGHVSNWQSYMLGLKDGAGLSRDELMKRLWDEGVPTRRSVMAIHLEPAYRSYNAHLPHTEHAFRHNLLLPVYDDLEPEQQRHIISAIGTIMPD